MIRLAEKGDLRALLELYTHLYDQKMPDELPEALWDEILADPSQHVIVMEQDGLLVSTCVLVIIPNLTHNQTPYALIEMVVTHAAYRKRGYASAVLDLAREIAVRQGCYKIMLMTGCKDEATLRFYENAGYNREDKTGFVQWLG